MIVVNLDDYERFSESQLRRSVEGGDYCANFVLSLTLLSEKREIEYAEKLLEDACFIGVIDAIMFLSEAYTGSTFKKNTGLKESREKEILFRAVAEQYNSKKDLKILHKIANGKNDEDKKLLDAADRRVLYESAKTAIKEAKESRKDFDCLHIDFEKNNEDNYQIVFEFGNNLELKERVIMLDTQFTQSDFTYIYKCRDKKPNYDFHLNRAYKMICELVNGVGAPLFKDFRRVGLSFIDKRSLLIDNGERKNINGQIDEKATESQPKKLSVIDKDKDVGDVGNDVQIGVKIITQSENLLEAAICSRCGNNTIDLSNVENGYVVCESCGTKFAINKNIIGGGSGGGFDSDALKMTMPKGAKIPKIKFGVREALDGKISMVMPKDFAFMRDEVRILKYPDERRPNIVYTNEQGTVNIALTVKDSTRVSNEQVSEFKDQTLKILSSLDRTMSFLDNAVLTNNGLQIGYYTFISKAKDYDIYNAMFCFSLKGTLVMGACNCLAHDRWFYTDVFKVLIESISTL